MVIYYNVKYSTDTSRYEFEMLQIIKLYNVAGEIRNSNGGGGKVDGKNNLDSSNRWCISISKSITR